MSVHSDAVGTEPAARGRIIVATIAADRAQRVVDVLGDAGYDVRVVDTIDGLTGDVSADSDAVLIDVTGVDPSVVDRLVRHANRTGVAVLAFTASTDLSSGLAALEAGVDDLLTPAVTPPEFVARVRAAIRRRSGRAPQPATVVLTGGPVVIDVGRRRVTVFGREVMLTALELELLSYFLMHPDEPITRARLLEEVWGYSVGGTATVTVHVRRLREKIEPDPANPVLIRTVWGVGYRFSPSEP